MSPQSKLPRRAAVGPTRGTPSTLAAARQLERASARSVDIAPSKSGGSPKSPEQVSGGIMAALKSPISAGISGMQRLLAVGVVFGILFLMYAGNVATYLDYKTQIAQTRALIEERASSIDELQQEIERWKDPNYVRAQARERLGWVMPGEIGFRVVGPDGQPLGGGAVVTRTGALPDNEHPEQWFERLWGSVLVADAMIPVQSLPGTVTDEP